MKKNILFILFLLVFSLLKAQVPNKFNYQGVARNSNGVVLSNQDITLKASIIDLTPDGNVIYIETHSIKTNQLGLFSVEIGNGKLQQGNFSEINWGQNDKYFKIELDPTGGTNFTLIGINQLLSVPFALQAGNGSKWEKTENGIFNMNDIGIGTNNINKDVSGNNGSLYPDYNWHGLHIKNKDNTLLTLEGREFSRIHFVSNDGNIDSKNYSIQVGNKYNEGNSTYLDISSLNDKFYVKNRGIVLHENGNVCIGGETSSVPTPKSKLHIKGGDIYIEDVTKGVIMKSPNGKCWRMTVSDSGQPIFNSITCPN